MISQESLYKQPIIKVLCGAVMISFSAVFVNIAEVTPTTSAFYRVFFGALFLLLLFLGRRSPLDSLRRSWPILGLCGFIFALDLYFWHESILYIGPGLATILGNFQVFILAAAGVLFFNEKLGLHYLAAIPLAILGLFLIVGVNWNMLTSGYKTGIYFGLLTALCYSIFLLCLRKIQGQGEHFQIQNLMLVSIFTALFLGMKMLYSADSFAIPDLKSASALLGLGLFSQTIGWLMIANALPKIRPSLAGLCLLIQPSLSFVWDVLFFNRPTELTNWFGVALTLGAIYLGITNKTEST